MTQLILASIAVNGFSNIGSMVSTIIGEVILPISETLPATQEALLLTVKMRTIEVVAQSPPQAMLTAMA
jgi:hypothetical protein